MIAPPVNRNTAAPWIAALAIAGSLLIHLAVLSHSVWLEWLALVTLSAVPLANGLLQCRLQSWLWLLGLAAAAAFVTSHSGGALALYLPSVALPVLLAWLFGRSLAAGRTPLVVLIARVADRQLPDYLVAYSRRLTQMWLMIFVIIGMVDAALILSGRRELWSLVANFGNYVLIAAIVLIEYLYRRWRFGDYAHPGFVEYLRVLVRASPRQMS